MACLETIIRNIQDTFQIHVHGPVFSDQRIESVYYLLPPHDDQLPLDPHTLYIGNYKDFPPPFQTVVFYYSTAVGVAKT